MIEGYSRVISSAGFWPGGGPQGTSYSCAYPLPGGFKESPVPAPAYYSDEFGVFLLPDEAVRTAADPDQFVADFLKTTFDAASTLAQSAEGKG